MDQERFEKGLETRKSVLSAEHVENTFRNTDELTRPLQEIITEICWGQAWADAALDRPRRSILTLGILATLANEQPVNLMVVVWDNECYQSIGGPPTHTAFGRVDIARIAAGAGIEHAYTASTLEEFERHCKAALEATAPYLIVAKVEKGTQSDIKRKHSDGREDKYIFVRHVEATEGIVIMGPSEHN